MCAARFTGLLFDGFEASEIEMGSAAGFLGGHACHDVVGDLAIEMEAELGIEMFFGLLFSEEAS
jgi:hypothetical protein